MVNMSILALSRSSYRPFRPAERSYRLFFFLQRINTQPLHWKGMAYREEQGYHRECSTLDIHSANGQCGRLGKQMRVGAVCAEGEKRLQEGLARKKSGFIHWSRERGKLNKWC